MHLLFVDSNARNVCLPQIRSKCHVPSNTFSGMQTKCTFASPPGDGLDSKNEFFVPLTQETVQNSGCLGHVAHLCDGLIQRKIKLQEAHRGPSFCCSAWMLSSCGEISNMCWTKKSISCVIIYRTSAASRVGRKTRCCFPPGLSSFFFETQIIVFLSNSMAKNY
jgi:hypothetical protein